MRLVRSGNKVIDALLGLGIQAVAALLKLKVHCSLLQDRLASRGYDQRELGDPPEPNVCLVDGYHGGLTFWDWIIMPEGGTWSVYNWPVVAEPILKQVLRVHSLAAVFELDGHTYGWIAAEMPEAADLIRQVLNTGRLEIVNGTYAQPLAGIFDDESYIRHFYYGLHEIDRALSYKVDVFASQEPAFFPQLPQILRSFGFKLAILRTHWAPFGTDPTHPSPLINWRSADGRSILTVPRYPFMAYKKKNAEEIDCGEVEMHYGKTSDNCFMATHLEPINFSGFNSNGLKQFQAASHRTGFNLPLLTRLEDFNLLSGAPLKGAAALSALQDISFVTFRQYLDCLLHIDSSAIESAPKVYFSADQFPCFFPWGLQGAVPLTAAQEASRMLLEAECLAALTFLSGKDQDSHEVLGPAWKKTLQAQHHDLHLCGPWLSRKHQKSMGAVAVDLAGEAQTTARRITKKSLQLLCSGRCDQKETADPESLNLYIFNNQDHQRRDIVFIDPGSAKINSSSLKVDGSNCHIEAQWLPDDGKDGCLALELELDAFSGKKVFAGSGKDAKDEPAITGRTVTEVDFRNRHYQACLNSGGELMLTALNNSASLRGAYCSAWSEDRIHDSRCENKSIKLVASGPVADLYSIEGTVAAMPFKEVFSFYKNLPRVDIKIIFDFGEGVFIGPQKAESKPGRAYYAQNEKKLNLNFITRPNEVITAGGTFLVERRKSEDFCANGFIALDAEKQPGWALFRPGSCGYRWDGSSGHLQTVLAWGPREWLYASEDSIRVGGSAYTILRNRLTYRCSLMLVDGTDETLVRNAKALLNPFSAIILENDGFDGTLPEENFLTVNPDSPVITAFFAQDQKVYLRLCNYTEHTQSFSLAADRRKVRPVSMNLEPLGQAREVLTVAPGKIQTLQIV